MHIVRHSAHIATLVILMHGLFALLSNVGEVYSGRGSIDNQLY